MEKTMELHRAYIHMSPNWRNGLKLIWENYFGWICLDLILGDLVLGGLRTTMAIVWKPARNFSIRVIGPNIFQFLFQCEEDKLKVLKGKTWTFDGQYLILKEWRKGETDFRDDELKVDLWVQIHKLLLHLISAETGVKIGKLFSNVLDVVAPDARSNDGRIVKILAEVKVSEPLPRGTMIKLGREEHWVEFRYEKLLGFCFYCGRIGHNERQYDTKKEDIQRNVFKTGQYGDWLRAMGGGFEDLRDKKSSTPSNSPNMVSLASQMHQPGVELGGVSKDERSIAVVNHESEKGGKSSGDGYKTPLKVGKSFEEGGELGMNATPKPIDKGPSLVPMEVDALKETGVSGELVEVEVQSGNIANNNTKAPKTFTRIPRNKKEEKHEKATDIVSNPGVKNVWKVAGLEWCCLQKGEMNFRDWWEEVCKVKAESCGKDRVALSTYILWWLWKTRNGWVFNGEWVSEKQLVDCAYREWIEYDNIVSYGLIAGPGLNSNTREDTEDLQGVGEHSNVLSANGSSESGFQVVGLAYHNNIKVSR
ncbi:Unknown protein [Striga hermonthica]|uniref:DUF4283 domain-containing protein n=1 Tax=Striga hermonthica TaxID=68872 RepID=A0A9N7REH6_STRHE|nr:Unknown protein [Striga hermonthica]